MKSRLTALLLTLALLLTALPVCTAEEEASATRMPFYDVFPLQLDDNTVLELPVDWGYQFVELEGVPPIAYAMNDSEQLLMMVKIPADYTPNEASDRLGLTSFIPEGTAVMLGITTPQSTRLQEMTINDMPAVLVEMNGQGFDILWIGDSGDLYFLMFPNDDDAFVQQALEVGQSLRVFHRKDERVNPASDFAYTTENGEVTITDYTGTREHVLIPSEIGGFPVTMLADKAFYEKHVTTVVVPDSVTEIEGNPFKNCKALRTVELSPNHPLLTVQDGMLIDHVHQRVLRRLTTGAVCIVPEGIKEIADGAFGRIPELTEITLPGSLEKIGEAAFIYCGMREITIPKGIAEIARMAFYHCDQLETVHLQEGLRGIGWDAFSECASLSDIRLPNTLERIELRAFAHCTSLKQLTIPASVTTLYAGFVDADTVLLVERGATMETWLQEEGYQYTLVEVE